jgi:hypothetical protein
MSSKAATIRSEERGSGGLPVFLRENGLTLVLLALFLLTLGGHAWSGWLYHLETLQEHGAPRIGFEEYLTSGAFVETVGENWESEFLQMLAFVYLGTFLFQRGSPESKEPDKEEDVDEDPRKAKHDARTPWPVRRGGWILSLYEHSLGIALFLLFVLSFVVHAIGGAREYNEDQLLHGADTVTLAGYLGTSRFWFESMQNWQSEFLAVAALVFLTVHLRQRGSPQSKPVATPHREHGE